MQRKFHRGTAAALLCIAMLLTACGKSGGGGSPDPDPDPDPPAPDDSISGTVTAPEAGNLSGMEILLCEAGTDCGTVEARKEPSGRLGRSHHFEFTHVPAGSYDLRVTNAVLTDSHDVVGHDVGEVRNVSPGSNDIDLQLEFIPVDPDDDKAAMTGVLRLPGGLGNASIPSGSAAVLDVQALSLTGAAPEAGQPAEVPLPASAPAEPEAMPGEIIVRFRDTELSAQSVPASLSTTGVRLELLQAGDAGSLYRAPSLSSAETIALAEELAARPDVKSATPNWILHAFAEPNDEHYELQWHYDAINLPAAWDVTTGSSDVTVAVLDSGSIEHPDLDFLDGYDFISDPDLSGDNRSRNSDPEDPGIGSNYHGAHVAGTIGATTDNGVGVAGVSWDVGIVPVRVLGVDGKGALFDVLDGASWAAGNNVPGAPSNNHPADVINLSLGFSSGLTCKEVLGTDDDSFFADLDAITVVAAGNDGIDTRGVFPANCPGVITVGATGAENEQTSYSNFGPEVDVMAPGGSTSASFTKNGRTYPYQVFSTILDANKQPGYGFSVGTSMATPHVSGVIALLLSEEPGLSFNEVKDRLQNSASSNFTCGKGGCGSGLVDARAALDGSSGGGAPPPPPATEVTTYILFSECADDSCPSPTPQIYLELEDVPPGAIRYLGTGLDPGLYIVEAWQDLGENTDMANGQFAAPGDPYVILGAPVELKANKTTTGVDLDLTKDVFSD